MTLIIAPSAAQHISQQKGYLRIRIKSGGCAGLRAIFTFEESKQDNDHLFSSEGANVVVDPLSMTFVDGATLDYKDEMIASQFVLNHPKASNACGCGESFSFS